MDYAGLLTGIEPPPPSRNIRLLPYVAAERRGGGATTRSQGDIGGDLKWAVSGGRFSVRGRSGAFGALAVSQGGDAESSRSQFGVLRYVARLHGESAAKRGRRSELRFDAPLGLETRLAANPRLQLVTFTQWNTAARQLSGNARLTWEYRPLAFFTVIYNHRVAVPGLGVSSVAPAASRQLLVKVVWLIQL
jgi:hypothetical protein